jgi:hypothetical protein
MFQGVVSKLSEKTVASAGTLEANADILIVSGTVPLVWLVQRTGGVAAQKVIIVPLGALTCTAAGNISVAVTFVANRAQELVFSRLMNKWYPVIAAV